MKDKTLVYSWWLWFFSILYFVGVLPYSPQLSMILALVVSLYLTGIKFSKEYHWTKKVAIFVLELFFLLLTYFKDPTRSLFNNPDLLFNAVTAIIYFMWVHANNTTIHELYFKHFPESHKGETLLEHVYKFKDWFALQDK